MKRYLNEILAFTQALQPCRCFMEQPCFGNHFHSIIMFSHAFEE